MKPNLAVSSAKIKAQNPYARVKRRSLDGSMHYKKGRQEKIRPRPEADKISVSRSSPLFVSALVVSTLPPTAAVFRCPVRFLRRRTRNHRTGSAPSLVMPPTAADLWQSSKDSPQLKSNPVLHQGC